jgi:hypothetical protein
MAGVAACWLFIVHCTLWQPRNNISIPGIEKCFPLPKIPKRLCSSVGCFEESCFDIIIIIIIIIVMDMLML